MISLSITNYHIRNCCYKFCLSLHNLSSYESAFFPSRIDCTAFEVIGRLKMHRITHIYPNNILFLTGNYIIPLQEIN
jgi:hypothetical protein